MQRRVRAWHPPSHSARASEAAIRRPRVPRAGAREGLRRTPAVRYRLRALSLGRMARLRSHVRSGRAAARPHYCASRCQRRQVVYSDVASEAWVRRGAMPAKLPFLGLGSVGLVLRELLSVWCSRAGSASAAAARARCRKPRRCALPCFVRARPLRSGLPDRLQTRQCVGQMGRVFALLWRWKAHQLARSVTSSSTRRQTVFGAHSGAALRSHAVFRRLHGECDDVATV